MTIKIDLDNVKADLFSDKALEAAKDCSDKTYNKSTQIRRFYDELVMWHDKVYAARTEEERQQKFKTLEPYIQMLRAKVAYARGRKPQLVNDQFRDFFDDLIRQVNSPQKLRNAKLFMEAFMGFKKFLDAAR